MRAVLDLGRRFPGRVLPGLGIHPCTVTDRGADALAPDLALLRERAAEAAVIGETGLDHKWATTAPQQAEQEHLNLPDLYRHQNRASRKFSMISRAYEIGSGQTSERAIYHQLVGYLFRSSDDVDQVPGIEGILKQLAGALHAYFHISFDDERERAIAAAWQPLETALRALGREI